MSRPYWTSSERSNAQAWYIQGPNNNATGSFEANSGGQFASQSKNNSTYWYAVRAVHNIVLESEATYSYLWTPTNETTPDITVSPSSTTEYCVTVTYEGQCPSQDCQTITVLPDTHNVDTVEACGSYSWHGTTYTTTGVYSYLDPNAGPCQGADTLHLTIKSSTTSVDSQTACESYTWIDGVTYTESTNTPTYTLTNAAGCDSIVTLNLTINHGDHEPVSATACDSYTWEDGDGETYTQSGVYTYSYENMDGCPSTLTLNLTVNHGDHEPVSESNIFSQGTKQFFHVLLLLFHFDSAAFDSQYRDIRYKCYGFFITV